MNVKMELEAQKLQYEDKLQKLILKEKALLSFYKNNNKSSSSQEDAQIQEDAQSQDEIPTRLRGEYIERDFAKKRTQAQGKVQLSQRAYQAFAELATYDEDAELVTMQGNPGVYRNNTFIRAEKIFVYPQKEHIIFQNRVRGRFTK